MSAPQPKNEAAWDGICAKCCHRDGCSRLCAPVEQHLRINSRPIFQQSYITRNGKELIVVHPESKRFVQESSLKGIDPGKGENQLIFSTENNDPFPGFNPTAIKTMIFLDRLLFGYTYTELADKYGVTKSVAHHAYERAAKKVERLVELIDRGKGGRYFKARREAFEAKLMQLPYGIRCWLLNRLFDIQPIEIANLYNKTANNVAQSIRRVDEKLRNGTIDLIGLAFHD